MGLRLAARAEQSRPGAESTVPVPPEASPQSKSARPTSRYFGDYELLEEIARGGMGIVFKARQGKLDRLVAVKMILAGQFASREHALRFRAEVEAAARLQHPNIVRIHETGEQVGQPYFSMDYVEGTNLAALVREKPLPAKRAAGYVKTIAEAIHYAHEQGILHRDLKPSNVLIDSNDQPRVTDFGLAKRMQKESFLTVTGDVMGSPNFMPPEQAGYRSSRGEAQTEKVEGQNSKPEADQSLVTSAATKARGGRYSDVYGLGAILFYLVTGRPPFVAESVAETLHHVLNTEPVSPRLLNPSVPQDIATICLKCLEKEPAKRYQTAQQLADELNRFLTDEPILAHPISQWERALKWVKRKPAISALTGLLLFSVGLGVPAVIWQWRNAVRARADATNVALAEARERRRAEQALALMEIQKAEELFAANDTSTALAYLARVLRQNPTNETVTARVFSNLTQHVLIIPLARPLKHEGAVYFAQFSPDSRRVVTASADGTAQVWDANTGQPATPPLRHEGPVWFAQFAPDGRHVVTASEDKTARVWDTDTGQQVTPPLQHSGSVGYVYFSPDGERLVTGTWEPDWSMRLWDAKTGAQLCEPTPSVVRLRCPPFSSDSRRLVTSLSPNSAMIWDSRTGAQLAGPFKHDSFVFACEFSSDGNRFVTACSDGTVRIWDATNSQQAIRVLNHGKPLWLARFSPGGRRVFTVCGDMTTQVWDAETGRALTAPLDYPNRSDLRTYAARLGSKRQERAAQFSLNGQMIIIAFGNRPQLLDARTGRRMTEPIHHEVVRSAEFSRDNQRIVTASLDGTARIWAIRNGRQWPAVPDNQTNQVLTGFSPVPEWVPQLMEMLSESPRSDRGVSETVKSHQLEALAHRLAESSASDAWTRWGRWLFVTPHKDRTAEITQ